jgi:hypothetical protein
MKERNPIPMPVITAEQRKDREIEIDDNIGFEVPQRRGEIEAKGDLGESMVPENRDKGNKMIKIV